MNPFRDRAGPPKNYFVGRLEDRNIDILQTRKQLISAAAWLLGMQEDQIRLTRDKTYVLEIPHWHRPHVWTKDTWEKFEEAILLHLPLNVKLTFAYPIE